MPEGAPKYTPEQIAELEKSRIISDAELLKGGAEYMVDENGEKRGLSITEEKQDSLQILHKQDNHYKREEISGKKISQLKLHFGSKIKLKLTQGDERSLYLKKLISSGKISPEEFEKGVFFDKEHALDIDVMVGGIYGKVISVRLGDIEDIERAE